MSYWVNHEERKKRAVAHSAEMAKKHSAEINKSVAGSKIYTDVVSLDPTISRDKFTSIILVPEDSVSALFKYNHGKTCVLNFASYHNPGGKFIEGSSAQEESLCHESDLYNVLLTQQDYYFYNSSHGNRGLYTNRAIYSPDILFIHDDKELYADVLTCASPNWKGANRNAVAREDNDKALDERIKFVVDILVANKVDTAILGAYGCGVFAQDAYMVAKLFKKYLKGTGINVIFAVPNRGNGASNYDLMEKGLSEE